MRQEGKKSRHSREAKWTSKKRQGFQTDRGVPRVLNDTGMHFEKQQKYAGERFFTKKVKLFTRREENQRGFQLFLHFREGEKGEKNNFKHNTARDGRGEKASTTGGNPDEKSAKQQQQEVGKEGARQLAEERGIGAAWEGG